MVLVSWKSTLVCVKVCCWPSPADWYLARISLLAVGDEPGEPRSQMAFRPRAVWFEADRCMGLILAGLEDGPPATIVPAEQFLLIGVLGLVDGADSVFSSSMGNNVSDQEAPLLQKLATFSSAAVRAVGDTAL